MVPRGGQCSGWSLFDGIWRRIHTPRGGSPIHVTCEKSGKGHAGARPGVVSGAGHMGGVTLVVQ